MNFKDFKKRLNEKEYTYVAIPTRYIIVEHPDRESAALYAKAFQGIIWDHFPYFNYGFEDPYNFSNEWIIINEKGDIIEYDFNKFNIIEEVIKE